jgi:peptidoglycan/LPS O-acetylase OafA/YrhL
LTRLFPDSRLVWLLNLPLGTFDRGRFASFHLGWGGVLSNFLLAQNLSHSESILAPLWSLPYEMQMYLFLPLLYLLARRAKGVLPMVALWGVAAFLCSHTHRLQELGLARLIDLVIYIPCFLSGIVAFKQTKARTLRLHPALWPVALAALTIIYLRWSSRAYICCFLLGIAVPQFREIANPCVRRVAQIIARYSYGIYLTHYICIWLAFQGLSGLPMWARWLVLVGTVVVAPFALYHGLEEPMIRFGGRIVAKHYEQRCLKRQRTMSNSNGTGAVREYVPQLCWERSPNPWDWSLSSGPSGKGPLGKFGHRKQRAYGSRNR